MSVNVVHILGSRGDFDGVWTGCSDSSFLGEGSGGADGEVFLGDIFVINFSLLVVVFLLWRCIIRSWSFCWGLCRGFDCCGWFFFFKHCFQADCETICNAVGDELTLFSEEIMVNGGCCSDTIHSRCESLEVVLECYHSIVDVVGESSVVGCFGS